MATGTIGAEDRNCATLRATECRVGGTHGNDLTSDADRGTKARIRPPVVGVQSGLLAEASGPIMVENVN